ncbi:DUF3086 domain-containing protein [Pleurocapsa sp. FMAR1]|uniref:DUF3086 domain-containing protein n=1 Tax=Pleurocapsa sp. FMAR1 TaxID=3040204 RepID=UPI0029C793A4|nr:DUF3086 domain-containing protein [Pleurocapsa sp. FMAR1]
MNSENPSIPESDNTNSESIELDTELQPDQKESISQSYTDAWSKQDNVINVTIDSELSADDSLPVDNSQGKVEPLNVLEQSELNQNEISTKPSNVDSELDTAAKSFKTEPELFVDSWLDEPESNISANGNSVKKNQASDDREIISLKEQKVDLQSEIKALQEQKEKLLLQQVKDIQQSIGQMIEEGTKELQARKTALQIEIEKLERRKERINQEMRRNFAGSSQELALRVQGFKNYLVGSLQDLATAAEKLELEPREVSSPKSRGRIRDRENPRRDEPERDRGRRGERELRRNRNTSDQATSAQAQFSEPTFTDQSRRIRQLLDKYRNSPDYYGSPWQLRRTFEATHAKRVQNWFFSQGGRGTVDSMGSRLQNILVASAAVSILHSLYGDSCRILVLTDTPENLGEWRKGLQDCLGISRNSFGTNRGVVLFDSPEVLVQRAERLIQDKLLPMIIIDETEEILNLSVLKFPLWLAFASGAKSTSSNYLY